jgi:hypothetical protein
LCAAVQLLRPVYRNPSRNRNPLSRLRTCRWSLTAAVRARIRSRMASSS